MIFCGLFCAGKSTIAERVAKKMALPLYDTDRLMEIDQKKKVSEIWQALGESAFRDLETEAVLSIEKKPCVIATGGGTLLREENYLYLKELGTIVYLKASLPILFKRLLIRGMPLYLDADNPKAHFQQLAKERIPLFEKYCNQVIDTEKQTLDSCVFEVVNNFSFLKKIKKLI